MKSTIFWDITPCSPLSVYRRFRGAYCQYQKNKFSEKPAWKQVPPKRRLTLNALHGVSSQKMVLLITTAVRTSNPTFPHAPPVSSLVWNVISYHNLVFQNVMLCGLVDCYQRFRGIWYLHLLPEDGDKTFLQNIGDLPDYAASHHRG
jgi:hypothetical protein